MEASGAPPPPASARDGRSRDRRPALDRLTITNRRGVGSVQVVLDWPNGEQTTGGSLSGSSLESRARAATVAVREALEPRLNAMHARLDVDEVIVEHAGNKEAIVVIARFYQRGVELHLSGSAFIGDDVASAAARATLAAVNRKIVLPAI